MTSVEYRKPDIHMTERLVTARTRKACVAHESQCVWWIEAGQDYVRSVAFGQHGRHWFDPFRPHPPRRTKRGAQ